MYGRKLKLNSNKTECILIGSATQSNIIQNFRSIKLEDQSTIVLSEQVRDLGFTLDSNLTLDAQIQKVKSKAIGNLINISRISAYLDKSSRLKLVHGLVFSRIDFCNPLYFGLPNTKLKQLQLMINDATRLVAGLPRFSRERITPITIELHFLPIKARIHFKICLLA